MPRIVVLGTSGAGKSTLATALARFYVIPHIDLDELPNDELRARVEHVLATTPAWVIDGDYQRLVGDSVLSAAGTAVWLDLPLRVSLLRMWRRTLRKRLLREPRLLVWVGHEVKSHLRRRLTMPARLRRHGRLRVVRLRSQREIDHWLGSVD